MAYWVVRQCERDDISDQAPFTQTDASSRGGWGQWKGDIRK